MTAAQDKKFFNTALLVLGILIAIAVVLYVLARFVGQAQDINVAEDPAMKAAVAERIAPIGEVAVAGQDNSALAAPTQQAAAAPAPELPGEQVFSMACLACHGAGVAGAPKYADATAWKPRIAKGAATLHKHAIEGFQGEAGFMPPKGGRVDLSDKSIMNAVDYMLAGVK